MSMETENSADTSDNLDTFSSSFFGQEETSEPASSEDVETETEEIDAQEDTQLEADTLADEDEGEQEEDAEEVSPKPKKNRFQERIDQLNAKAYEAERREKALREEFEALKQKLETKEPVKAKASVEEVSGPQPTDLNEDGSDKYPLGEFDPKYIKDYTRHVLAEERAEAARQQEESRQKAAYDAERASLQTSWEEKLGPAQERYPDFREKGENLLETFSGVDQQYGEYLTTVLMSLDHGPDVLYYLANNVEEADRIVKSGATKAVLAIGAINATFEKASETKQVRPKISKAPTPPEHLNKGSAVARIEVPDDTDDLDAFSSKLFTKKGK